VLDNKTKGTSSSTMVLFSSRSPTSSTRTRRQIHHYSNSSRASSDGAAASLVKMSSFLKLFLLGTLVLVMASYWMALVRVPPFSIVRSSQEPPAAAPRIAAASKQSAAATLAKHSSGGGEPQQQEQQQPVKIAHVISLITCHKASRVKGFLDALIILRHSIHQNSIHANNNDPTGRKVKKSSNYSYQMYAILHQDGGCLEHFDLLKRIGYIPLVKPTPINVSQITSNDWYRDHVEQENCCGSKEFIKLYAYTLTEHPIVVHWDLDVAVLQPLDDLYDAMLYNANTETGRAARQRLRLQRPSVQQLPASNNNDGRIDAFFTRDYTSARPWEKITAVQGGFVVARPSMEHFELYKEFIMEANYTPGRGPTSGWGGLGYGGFQGAMAYQGVLAYFYDVVYPGHAVELDVCRWNQVVADVIWRGPEREKEHYGQCRHYPAQGPAHYAENTPENGQCEDCRIVPIEETYTVHYTACKKPWECTVPYPRVPRNKRDVHRLQELTNVTTCGKLHHRYFEIRRDIEDRIAKQTGLVPSSRDGTFHPEFFYGYCKAGNSYLSMEDIPETFDMKQVYGF
jgi:hypothetical protein